jgi:cyclophilin family peptidyl-prolyl cis-trans isomerase
LVHTSTKGATVERNAPARGRLRGAFRLAAVLLVLTLALTTASCSSEAEETTTISATGDASTSTTVAPDNSDSSLAAETSNTGETEVNADNPQVELVTSMGTIVLELDQAAAPITVENFLSYVQAGFYDGTIFHRVIPGFMAQGGGFTPDMTQKPTDAPIKNEADNGLKNLRGTIAMARTGVVDSATAQFFVNVADNDFLNHAAKTVQGYGYAVFGKVVEGMDVVDAIVAVPTTSSGPFQDVPQTPIVIESAKVLSGE